MEESAFLNIINHKPGIDKTCLYPKHPHEAKYQFLIDKRESTGLKYLNHSKAFIQYLENMDDIYKSTEEYNLNKKPKKKMIWFLIYIIMKNIMKQ